jgi:ABC-type cobalamin/Fe3+-siderophores transport system ATPase subunit
MDVVVIMQKIFGVEKLNFYLSEITTSIIYNDEKVKNEIIRSLKKTAFLVIDTKTPNINVLIKDYLKSLRFNMQLIPYFDLENYLNKSLLDLTFEEQIFVKIISLICNCQEKIVFDDVLTFLNEKQKYLVLKYLKDNNNIFYNFTSDMEEVLYTKYLVVLSKDGVIIEGATKSVLKEEKIIKHNGFNLPFVVDLSCQLKDYGILDKEYYSLEKLVSDLWK